MNILFAFASITLVRRFFYSYRNVELFGFNVFYKRVVLTSESSLQASRPPHQL